MIVCKPDFAADLLGVPYDTLIKDITGQQRPEAAYPWLAWRDEGKQQSDLFIPRGLLPVFRLLRQGASAGLSRMDINRLLAALPFERLLAEARLPSVLVVYPETGQIAEYDVRLVPAPRADDPTRLSADGDRPAMVGFALEAIREELRARAAGMTGAPGDAFELSGEWQLIMATVLSNSYRNWRARLNGDGPA